jgi:hypothetical protein
LHYRESKSSQKTALGRIWEDCLNEPMPSFASAVPDETLAGTSRAEFSIADALSRGATLVLSAVTVEAKDFGFSSSLRQLGDVGRRCASASGLRRDPAAVA